MISIVRDPWSWYASARRWGQRLRNLDVALDEWCETAEATLEWRERQPDRVRLLSFDDLVSRTETTMRDLAAWLEIDFAPSLLDPTFSGLRIRANTSFGDVKTKVSTKPLERALTELDHDDVDYIERRARGLYDRLLERTRGAVSAPSSGEPLARQRLADVFGDGL